MPTLFLNTSRQTSTSSQLKGTWIAVVFTLLPVVLSGCSTEGTLAELEPANGTTAAITDPSDSGSSHSASESDTDASNNAQTDVDSDVDTPVDPALNSVTPVDTNNSLENLPVLQYPEDFPASVERQFIGGAVRVEGLQALQSYTFSTDPGHTVSAQNLLENNQSFACFDNDQCTGTVIGSSVAVIVIAATNNGEISSTPEFSIDIVPADAVPVYYEGTVSSPVQLSPGSYTGRVGSTRGHDDLSYYTLQNLVVGDRYELTLSSITENRLDSSLSITQNNGEPLCDPNDSGEFICRFVALNTSAAMQVHGEFAIFGEAFDISLALLSSQHEFEGSWLHPVAIPMDTPELAQHRGHVDEYHSYYNVTGLENGAGYTITLHSPINASTLHTVSAETGTLVGGICEFDNPWDNTGTSCTFVASGSTQRIALAGSDAYSNAQYIFSIRGEAASQGSSLQPMSLNYGQISEAAVARSNSYYRVQNLPPGSPVVVTATTITGSTVSLTVDNGGDRFACTSSCVFTPTGNTAGLVVTPDEDAIQSTRYWLSVMPPPVNETGEFSAAELPAKVQVGSFFSNYTVTGLLPDTAYLVDLRQPDSPVSLSVIGDTTLQCRTNNASPPSGCAVHSNSSGEIPVRIGATSAGAWATLHVNSYSLSDAEFVAVDTPLNVPENDVTGSTSTIDITNSGIATIQSIIVDVDLDHDYTDDVRLTLIAPDGRRVVLMEHLGGTRLMALQFDDYAAEVIGEHDLRFRVARRPQSPLHSLRNLPADGQWQLEVIDDQDSNLTSAMGGTLLSWGLSFNPE